MEIVMRSHKFVVRIGILYRLHVSTKNGITMSGFFDEFSELLGHLTTSSGKLLLLGDFNFHVDDAENDAGAANLLDLLNLHNLRQHVSVATHRNKHILDLVITREDEQILLNHWVNDPGLSDHYFIHCNLTFDKPQPVEIEKVYRKIRDVDIETFRSQLAELPLLLDPADTVSDLSTQYHKELSRLVEIHAPLKRRKVLLRPSAPWYTEEIALQKRKRRMLERKWRKNGCYIDYELYIEQCNNVREFVRSSRMHYYSEIISENACNPRNLFKAVDRLLHRKDERRYPTCESGDDLCSKFSNFFRDKISAIRAEMPILSDDIIATFNYLDEADTKSQLEYFVPTNVDEVAEMVKKSIVKSCCLDPIPSELLKCCFNDLLPVIVRTINLSFDEAVMPSCLKRAVVLPGLKKPLLDHELFVNFRPVSNLQFLAKAIEKVAVKRMLDYLEYNGLEESLQSAYKKYHSCETALVRVQNDILIEIDNNCCVVLLLLDLSAAFDTVDHEILLKRLSSRFGIKGKVLEWFKSYLKNRSQFVQIDGYTSEIKLVECGVPQGSVLGLLLYLLYTAPIGDIFRKHGLSFHLYADDDQVYSAFSCQDYNELVAVKQRIELCMAEVNNWMMMNKLKLNTDKTELLVLHSKFRSHIPFGSLMIGNDVIFPSDYARNIGVIFDEIMSSMKL